MLESKRMATRNQTTQTEKDNFNDFIELYEKCPIPINEKIMNLGLFLPRHLLSRIMFMHSLYKRIINVHGSIIEFGTRWGQNLALFESFRGMYEPYNYNRKIIGFDSFNGYQSIEEKDGRADIIQTGAYGVTEGYENYLKQLLECHEKMSPISHIPKYQLIKGDAVVEIENYFKNNPHTIVALAYFDFALYKPTKKGLEIIRDHLTKGSVIGFDELNIQDFPGETQALKEVLGLGKYSIRRVPYNSLTSYIVID